MQQSPHARSFPEQKRRFMPPSGTPRSSRGPMIRYVRDSGKSGTRLRDGLITMSPEIHERGRTPPRGYTIMLQAWDISVGERKKDPPCIGDSRKYPIVAAEFPPGKWQRAARMCYPSEPVSSRRVSLTSSTWL